jgi:hypothetical protein
MGTGNGQTTPADFSQQFDKLTPLIREEWPALDAARLAETKGDYDQVVALIAAETKHTKALVRKQLEELKRVSQDKNDELGSLRQILDRMQARTVELAGYVREQMMPEATQRAKKNFFTTLLIAIGLGFIVGFLLRGGRRGGNQ